jgi:hypothetical protein
MNVIERLTRAGVTNEVSDNNSNGFAADLFFASCHRISIPGCDTKLSEDAAKRVRAFFCQNKVRPSNRSSISLGTPTLSIDAIVQTTNTIHRTTLSIYFLDIDIFQTHQSNQHRGSSFHFFHDAGTPHGPGPSRRDNVAQINDTIHDG